MTPVLEAQGLAKAFGGVRAVDGVGFAVAEGEVVALIGPNGAGKSTCFNMLNGQLRPDTGRILLNGRDVTGLPPRKVWRMGVGRTFQVTATFASMTVRENVQMALLSHRRRLWSPWVPARELYVDEADALLAQVDMVAQADRPCGVLAYGDLKRLELAVAVAHRPRLLLMDEPTAGMAPQERASLMRLVAGFAERDRVAVLFTEHDMDVVFTHARRVLVLDRGRLVAEGPPEAVRANPMVQAVYLGAGGLDGEAA
ncbi:MAG TPA: ABC transporter ATP-binding protein [Azospirillaceae bacterium]|nr:ABC transporter ATP-binding protein [Azospirillaceae bacterium]